MFVSALLSAIQIPTFALVFALELAPMITFIRVRAAHARGFALPPYRSRPTGGSTTSKRCCW